MKCNMMKMLSIPLLLLIVASGLAQSAADKVVGVYYVKDDQSSEVVKIRIYKCSNGTYAGKVVWMQNAKFKDGTPKTDIKNPDPSKRKTPADKIQMLSGFTYNSKEKKWVDGKVYDPIHGKTYKSQMWFGDDKTLNLRGYIGIPSIGRTMVWKKIA